jgi:DNA-binding NtrC family response regulator
MSRKISPLWLVEKVYIEYALEVCNGNRTHTARVLEISLRTLRNKIRQYKENPQGRPRSHKNWGLNEERTAEEG